MKYKCTVYAYAYAKIRIQLRYVEKFNLGKHFRLNTKAVNITRSERGWNIVIQSTNDPDCQESLSCDKLIIATGINSHPKIPDIDMSTYTGVSMHSISIASRYKELLTEDIKTVTVVGGHKSALEAVGLCAQAGKTVNWLVRKEGGDHLGCSYAATQMVQVL